MTDAIPAVIYGVKSSPDEKESVADQHRITREAIEREGGRTIDGEPFGEANQSGYRKERGPQLEAAMTAAVAAAAGHGEAELWVWHSSRLARGDGTKGRRSIAKLVHDLLYEGVTVRSATDDAMVSPMLAGIASTVSNGYSENLSVWTKAGVQRRREGGQPVGALPGIGYEVDVWLDDRGRRCSRRIVSPTTAPYVFAAFERTADGQTPGAVGRWLNAEGVRTVRGAPFVQRTVRKLILNDAFLGQKGYPRIVSDELAQRARSQLRRLDPAESQRRKGGRRPTLAYPLRGVVFCAACKAPLYPTWDHRGEKRTYHCGHSRQSSGECRRRPIPAELLESHVLNHLSTFVGSVEAWIADQLGERRTEALARRTALDARNAALAALDRHRGKLYAEYERLIAADDPLARYALEPVAKLDRQCDQAREEIAEAEAVLSEFSAPPDVDAALDFYNELVDVVTGRIERATSAEALNAALASVLSGLWCELDPDHDNRRLLVRFALRAPERPIRLLDGTPLLPELDSGQRWLPPVTVNDEGWVPVDPFEPESEPPETRQLTTVSACWP
jgi:DNA invertase Pin-like site-specific DNA recombinase